MQNKPKMCSVLYLRMLSIERRNPHKELEENDAN
jgi:hypothetical protein